MQSELTVFSENDTESTTAQPAATTDTSPVFTGEISTPVFEEIARHITGAFDHILITATKEAFTLQPYVTKDQKDMLSKHIRVPVSDWESYNLLNDQRYTAAIDPFAGLLQAFTGQDTGETVSITIRPQPDATEKWDVLQNHPLYEPNFDGGNGEEAAVDTLTIEDHEATLLRNPSRDVLSVNTLSYHTHADIDATYEMKTWFSSTRENTDDSVILVAASTGSRYRDYEYVLTLTEIDTEQWEPVGESLILPGGKIYADGEGSKISNVNIGGMESRPDVHAEQHLPDAHEDATNITYAFYRPNPLHGMFKHVLKDSLETGTFKFEMVSKFPMQITHDIETALPGVESNTTVTHMLAPVLSPQ